VSREEVKNSPAEETKKIWRAIELSRHPKRPYTLDYLEHMFSDYEELKGDRSFADDPALITGVGTLKKSGKTFTEKKVFFIGHQKGRNTKEKIHRNFGMAKPEGYRKACRMFDLAERFKRPIITFIDTPGAYPGVGAEQRGQAEAIGASIAKMLECKSPSVGVVLGEGGSGGALAIGVPDSLLMLENSTYSVISPESCAAILWGTASEAKRAAVSLKPRAVDVKSLGICDEVIKEIGAGAHEDPAKMAATLLKRIHHHFAKLEKMTAPARMKKRYEKYRLLDEHILS